MADAETNKTNLKELALKPKPIKITTARAWIKREPLLQPFGFKGGSLSELWQVAVQLKSENDHSAIGLGVQSVLWSDPAVFSTHTEEEGNQLMWRVTEEALRLIENTAYIDPVMVWDELFDPLFAYGKKITGNEKLRKTFILNALVPIDYALWLLYAQANEIRDFDTMIPAPYRNLLSGRSDKLAAIPVISYGMRQQAIDHLLNEGYFFLKIKIGHAGDPEQMLGRDKDRMSFIHHLAGKARTPYTADGKVRYYLDANGRYPDKEYVKRLIDHLDKIGATDQVVLLEEPFSENSETDVSDVKITVAMDESAHGDGEVRAGIQMGYGALALKPVAKTFSMTLKMLQAAKESGIPCFCADLTANPVLVAWNKSVAARLPPFPGMGFNLLETNGHQHYKNWNQMQLNNPCHNRLWVSVKNGIFELDKAFYDESACIFSSLTPFQKPPKV